jgi:cation diffusion facilitator CzcD-associated flavoprotein CzcO
VIDRSKDVIVVGGGQAALAVGFYLRRSGLDYVILDDQPSAGGAWRRGWKSLRAFSPAQWSSLPGWLMPPPVDGSDYPSRSDVVEYLGHYESRYGLNIVRSERVLSVERNEAPSHPLRVKTVAGEWVARAVISATGGEPFIPDVPGRSDFRGIQLHSLEYSSPAAFAGKRVIVVGGGNSGAQIVAELTEPESGVAHVTWSTLQPPSFLPDEIDGRYLFEQATERYRAEKEGRAPGPPRNLGDVVMVQSVRAARDRGTLNAVRMFERLDSSGAHWPDGTHTKEDVIIWATGFRPSLSHLDNLGAVNAAGRIEVAGAAGTRSVSEPRLWLVGYGNWTGYASATLIGVGRSARATVQEIQDALKSVQPHTM